MKADFDFDIRYKRPGETEERTYIQKVDYFQAMYFRTVLVENTERYSDVQVARYRYENAERVFDNIVALGDNKEDATKTLLGGQLIHNRYSSLIHDELSAKILAAGIETGIARCVSYLQVAACNTSDDVLSGSLDEVAEDLLIYAPSYHVQWKSISELSADKRALEKQLETYKTLAADAQKEYHERLGAAPSFGIMDLPKTRKLLETITE